MHLFTKTKQGQSNPYEMYETKPIHSIQNRCKWRRMWLLVESLTKMWYNDNVFQRFKELLQSFYSPGARCIVEQLSNWLHSNHRLAVFFFFACARLRTIYVAAWMLVIQLKFIRTFLSSWLYVVKTERDLASFVFMWEKKVCVRFVVNTQNTHLQNWFIFHWNGLTPTNNCLLIVTVMFIFMQC